MSRPPDRNPGIAIGSGHTCDTPSGLPCQACADQYVTRADAARPVLHFTGRADMEASMDSLAVEWWRLPAWQARQDYERPTTDTMIRIHAISRTLEPPHD